MKVQKIDIEVSTLNIERQSDTEYFAKYKDELYRLHPEAKVSEADMKNYVLYQYYNFSLNKNIENIILIQPEHLKLLQKLVKIDLDKEKNICYTQGYENSRENIKKLPWWKRLLNRF